MKRASDPLFERFRRKRDEASFRALYARHAAALNGTLRRLLGGQSEELEDAFQETWRRAIERLDDFRAEARFGTWLIGIAVNCARERLRQRGDRGLCQEEPLDQLASREGPDPAFDVARVSSEALAAAIAGLPNGYRTVFVLHDVEGRTHQEIADMLRLEVGTSKSQLTRARSALRRALAGAGEAR